MRTTLKNELNLFRKKHYFLTADVGFGVVDGLDTDYFNVINVGIAEQSMIGIASGLALSGEHVFTYTMSAFYLRALEQIKLDLCYQNAPVVMIGVGTGFDYEQLGTTHFGLDDHNILRCLSNIDIISPKNREELKSVIRKIKNRWVDRPTYIRIGRFDKNNDVSIKLETYPTEGGDLNYYTNKYVNSK